MNQNSMINTVDKKQSLRHDINNLLTLYHGYVALLAKPDLSLEKRKEYADILTQSFHQMALILEADGLDSLDIPNQSLGEIWNHLLKLYQEKINQFKLDIHFEDNIGKSLHINDLCKDRMEQAALYRIFLNLLDNAIIYNHSSGKVFINLSQEGDLLKITVLNTVQQKDIHQQNLVFGIGLKSVIALAEGINAKFHALKQNELVAPYAYGVVIMIPAVTAPVKALQQDNPLLTMRGISPEFKRFVESWQGNATIGEGVNQSSLHQSIGAAFKRGKREEIFPLMLMQIARDIENGDYWRQLAIACAALGEMNLAIEIFKIALDRGGDSLNCFMGLFRLSFEQGEHYEALGYLEALVQAATMRMVKYDEGAKFAAAWHDKIIENKGDSLLAKRIRFLGAKLSVQASVYTCERARQMIKHDQFPISFENIEEIATLYSAERRYDELYAIYQNFLTLYPDNLGLIGMMAKIAVHLGNYDAAEQLLSNAVKEFGEKPALISQLGYVEIHNGDFKAGYAHCAKSWDNPEFLANSEQIAPIIKQPRLKHGTNIQNKHIFILQRDGYGGMIQYLRFIAGLLSLGARVSVYLSDRQIPLASYIQNIYPQIAISSDLLRVSECDYWVLNEHLPAFFASEAETLPPACPAIPSSALIGQWQTWLNARRDRSKPLVAFSVSGDHSNPNDHLRSMQLQELYQAVTPLVQLVNLQSWHLKADQAFMDSHQDILNPMTEIRDFMDSAAVLKSMDLVIAVDSGLIHLAGNQLCSSWGMLYDPPEYRWPAKGNTSPWYPQLKLYRQRGRQANQRPNWTPVLEDIKQDLLKFTANLA